MKKLRIIKNALKAIARNPTRTFLTTLGIVIGIAAVIALMEIGAGAQQTLQKSISAMGVNTIRIWPGMVTRGGISSGSGGRANLTLEDMAIVGDCQNVSAVSPVISVRGQIIYGNKNWRPFSINGVNEEYFDIANWQVEDGEPFDAERVDRGAKVCLVGGTIVKELFDGENPVGKDIRIQDVMFKVIGVLKTKGANMMGMDQDDTILAPWTAVKSRLTGAGSSSISVGSSSSSSSSTTSTTTASSVYTEGVDFYAPVSDSNMPPVRFNNVDSLIASSISSDKIYVAMDEVIEALREAHKLLPTDDNDFHIRTMAEFTDMLASQTKTMTNLLLCVACVSLLVGGVGIMNIMLVSVTERTREIGLRMAVGARAGDILRQFLIESVVICVFGGIIGIIVGHGASLALTYFMNWPSSTSYAAIALAVTVSAMVGIVFGYYPAWKAAKLDPIEALRYE